MLPFPKESTMRNKLVHHVFEIFTLMWLILYLRIKRLGRKLYSPSTCVDSALEILISESKLCGDPEWSSIRVGLGFVKTFLTFVPKWSDTNKVVRGHLGDLVSSIEDAFETAGLVIRSAVKRGDGDYLDAVRDNLLEKMELLKPRVRDAYDFLAEHAFQTTARHPPITEFIVWKRLCHRVLVDASSLSGPVFLHLEGIVSPVQDFGNFYFSLTSDRETMRRLAFRLEGTAICLARLLFLWWVEEMEDDDKIRMLWDVARRIKPTSPKILKWYVQAIHLDRLRDDYFFMSEYSGGDILVDLVFSPCIGSLVALRHGVRSLVRYLMDSYHSLFQPQPPIHRKVEQLRSEVEKVVSYVASLYYLSMEAHDVFQLLQHIELLSVEIFSTRLIQHGSSILDRTSSLESIYKGSSFVQAFLECHSDVCSEKLLLIFKRIEVVARLAQSLHLSRWVDPRVSKWEGRSEAINFRSVLDFKLMKIQAYLMEKMRCSPSLMFLVQDKILSLEAESELLRKSFSLLPLENEGDKELILTCINRVAEEETPLYYFLQSNRISENNVNQVSHLLSNLIGKVDLLNSEIQYTHLRFRRSALLTFPKTHQGMGFVVLFLEKIVGLMEYEAGSIGGSLKNQIKAIYWELHPLNSFFHGKVGEKNYVNPGLKHIWRGITQAAYEANYIIDWVLRVKCDWSHMFWLSDLTDEMKRLKSEFTNLVQMKNDGAVQTSEQMIMTQTSAPEVGEAEISLEDQQNIIINRLTRGISKRREVVTIYGMPGIGKTTLAKKVYDDPRVQNHFQRLAWCCVSQVYRKRELLLKILSDITKSGTDEIHKKTDHELLDMLYKGLKGRRYLVVMDDIWGTQAWEELRSAFSDDGNGSRILFTTRNEAVGLEAECNSVPHTLRFLTKAESWKLLQQKVFKDQCPKELQEVGLMIAEGCKGLPLAIVAIAGILKTTEKKADWWKHIEKDLNSHILESPEIQCMHILELSYNHLPDDLKPCFLYFAAFGEDSEVPVRKLIQLWIAEGFITKGRQEASLEDVAESYVMNLIARSLIMCAKKGSSGRVKACKVHDMLHKLCLRKVEEENFLQYINGYENLFHSSNNQLDYGVDSEYPSVSVAYDQHRLSICSKRKHFVMLKPSGPSVRTLLFSATSDSYPRCPYDDIAFIIGKFKILSILDIESINIGSSFPEGMEMLYPLRYLAISGDIRSVPSRVSKLWNLETFIVKGLMGKVELPDTLRSMSRLRHLHVSTQAIFRFLDKSSSQLDNVVSLSCPALFHGGESEEMMMLFPNLRKLKCTFSEPAQHSEKSIRFPVLDLLEELESLKITYYGSLRQYCQLQGVGFPLKLKKLSLAYFTLTWDDFSAIGELPNLKILKLVSISFDSPIWEMKDDEFLQLEYLKLESLKIVEWNACSDHLPQLQQLVLQSCMQLEEIPSSFGEISTLQMIELKWCSASAEKSIVTIQEQQLDYNNEEFKVFINGSRQIPDLL